MVYAANFSNKCNDLATYFKQKESDSRRPIQALSLLSYPISMIGNIVGSIGTLSTGRIHTALARIEIAMKRSLQPYIYRCPQLLTYLLIDISHESAKRLLNFSSVAEIETSEEFCAEIKIMHDALLQNQPQLKQLLQQDNQYSSQQNRSHEETLLLSALHTALMHEFPDSILRELLLSTVIYLKQFDEAYDITVEATLAIGRLILIPDERKYISQLENRFETNVRKLIADDRACRLLGGQTLFLAAHPDAIQFTLLYTTISELQDAQIMRCPSFERDQKIKEAKNQLPTLIKNDLLDQHLLLVKEIMNSHTYPTIQWLANDIKNYLQLPCFDLTSTSQPIKEINLLTRAWKRGKTIYQDLS